MRNTSLCYHFSGFLVGLIEKFCFGLEIFSYSCSCFFFVITFLRFVNVFKVRDCGFDFKELILSFNFKCLILLLLLCLNAVVCVVV